MKHTHLSITGTRSYTLKCGPSRMTRTGTVDGDIMTVVGTRKPRLRWWLELVVWHCWKRWRKVRIRL